MLAQEEELGELLKELSGHERSAAFEIRARFLAAADRRQHRQEADQAKKAGQKRRRQHDNDPDDRRHIRIVVRPSHPRVHQPADMMRHPSEPDQTDERKTENEERNQQQEGDSNDRHNQHDDRNDQHRKEEHLRQKSNRPGLQRLVHSCRADQGWAAHRPIARALDVHAAHQ